MSYIDRQYVYDHFGTSEVSGALYYGGRLTSTTGSYLDAVISEASSWVDSFLGVHHDVPVSPVPDIVKNITGWLVWRDLCSQANKPITQEMSAKLDHNQGFLNGIKNGAIILPGVSQDTESGKGATYVGPSGSNGGSSVSFSSLRSIF